MNLIQLQTKINNAKDLDFGTIFNQSIELFKKVWLQGLLTVIITAAMMIPFYFLMYMPLIAMGVMSPDSFEPGNETNFLIMFPFFIFMVVFLFFAMTISYAMQASFFRLCMQKDLGIPASDDYFHFFKKQYIPKILKISLAALGISILAAMLCGLPLIYAMVPVSFFSIMFAFNPELSASEIIKASFALGNKKWLLAFGLTIVASILAQIVGMLMCLIGVLVTSSFVYLPLYHIYKEVIGFEDSNEIHQIGDKVEF